MTLVLLDPRWPDLLPAPALALLRGPVSLTPELVLAGFDVLAGLDVVPEADVLISSDAAHPSVVARMAAGEPMVAAVPPPGRGLLDAVAVLDRLRSPGGCPWDAEQTHDTLRRYLVEECYELLDALQHGAQADVVEELGDVLLQVLFHARIAAESAAAGFTVDDVAAALVAKLVHRHPHVFGDGGLAGSRLAGGAPVVTVADQELRWDELKAVEKQRTSAVDGVASAQPALALAAKLVSRAHRAGLPAELVPAALAGLDGDAEEALRRTALEFAAAVRAAEVSARAVGVVDLGPVDWRAHWPS